MAAPYIFGIDFTSAPKRDKPIVLASCVYLSNEIRLTHFEEFRDWPAFEYWLGCPGPWIAGFDFPFGLPRSFVQKSGYGHTWSDLVSNIPKRGKELFSANAMAAFLAAHVTEDKHRKTDLKSKSHSPLKTRTNPPVGLMFYEGAWRLHNSDICIPQLRETNSGKIALEAYPGLLAMRLGERLYKNDSTATSAKRIAARGRLIALLESPIGEACGWIPKPMRFDNDVREHLLRPSGDWLDAAFCAVQAVWAYERRLTGFGLPKGIDPVEGWIVSA